MTAAPPSAVDVSRPSLQTLRMRQPPQYDSLEVSELFCPRCKTARPARRHLLLVLPTGNHFEYRCAACGTPVGEKKDNDSTEFSSILHRA